jgi:hypothetical protein
MVEFLPFECEISSINNFNGSSTCHLGDDIEGSSNMETEVCLQTCLLQSYFLIRIDELPFLVVTTGHLAYSKYLTFLIFVVSNLQHLSFDILENVTVVLEVGKKTGGNNQKWKLVYSDKEVALKKTGL